MPKKSKQSASTSALSKKTPVKNSKKSIPTTKNKKSLSKSTAKQRKKSTWLTLPSIKWLFYTSLKLLFMTLVTLFIYAIYLDSKVQKKFEGQRWQVPIQVFGKTPLISLGERIDIEAFTDFLLASGYQREERAAFKLNRAQQKLFYTSGTNFGIASPSFDFGDSRLPQSNITFSLDDGYVSELRLNNRSIAEVRLPPVLIDRILPESKEDRVIVGLEQLPEQLIDTLLLVEDRNFYHHYGVSPLGILRAAIANLKAGRTVQGGSTLTQQLVKNMFLTRDKTLWRKANEAIISLLLEYRYSKDQLLEAYVNEVYLGQHYANGIYGFGLAAQFYFGVPIDELSVAQMATLIGQIKGPSYYDPWRYPKRAQQRRDLILTLMFEQNMLSKSVFTQAISTQLSVRKTRRVSKQKQPAYLQLVKRELRTLLSEHTQQSGVKVFTGYDVLAQHKLIKTVKKQVPLIEKKTKQTDIEVGMMVTDHHTGEVVALIGGTNNEYAGFNRVLNAKRPIGSLIKPVIYLAALERYNTYNLATPLLDKPLAIEGDNGDVWRPKNYDGSYQDQVSLYQSLVSSLNVPTVNLGLSLGLNNIANTLDVLGYKQEVYMQPSLLLGAINMSAYDINQVYLPIAAKGQWRESHAINKITSHDGSILWQHESMGDNGNYNIKPQALLSSQASFLLNHALHGVTTEGTARSLTWRLPNRTVAGKTGTSNNNRDSWFIGFDQRYLVTTWMGKDNNAKTQLTGSSGALLLYADFMKQMPENNIHTKRPKDIEDVWFNSDTGQAYLTRCANSSPLPANTRGVAAIKCTDKHEEDKSWFERLFAK